MRLAGLALLVALLAGSAATAQQEYLVVVAGLGGDEPSRRSFHDWAMALVRAAPQLGVPDSHVVYLGEDPARDPARMAARSTKHNVEETLRTLARRLGPSDQVIVVLIGHGTEREGEPQFNLPGPDLTARDLAALLDALPAERVAVVNTASASGAFLPVLSAPGRVIVTATKSGFERNQTQFPRYLVEALTGGGADTDKDGRVSLLEAFDYARREVARAYEADGRLLTEHALLDDNGDGEGSAAPGADAADGALARTIVFGGPAAVTTGDPVLAQLYREKADLERRIAALRQRKEAMPREAYERQLEELLVGLAMNGRAIREREGRGRER